MARLNEPAAPTENIESLKRRFLRQNRDIARANSTQSLRIRNLENETSRLLSENLGLREQILQLQNELENGKAQRSADRAGAVKIQLEAKLLEISSLIQGLGESSPSRKKSPRVGKITRTSSAMSPEQKAWRNACAMNEALAGQEGRLPPILENKSYPRRTLESQDIFNMVTEAEADTTESPEIGPPPISQFVDEDPVKIDLPRKTKEKESEERNVMDPAISINLEQRRKRRESSGSVDSKRPTKTDSHPSVREATGSLKSGAKRKLSAREDEETIVTEKHRSSSPDDFKYTRVVSEDKAKSKLENVETVASRIANDLALARGASRDRASSGSVPTSRRVLAPKSVNNSPKKASRSLTVKDSKPTKPDSGKSFPLREPAREPVPGLKRVEPPAEIVLETIECQPEPEPEPETPAALEPSSPSSSHPSTARVESRDTPPPPDLGPGGEGHRPSRRARGAVSYAEPNLRDKMRRPTKELADAVSKDEKQRTSIVKTEVDQAAGITVKAEPEAEDAWKHMPAAISSTVEKSPLSNRTPAADKLPSSITTHRKRRESLLGEAGASRPTSRTDIAGLLEKTRRERAAAKEKAGERDKAAEVTIAKGMEDMRIYDVPVSEDHAQAGKENEKPVPRPSRRNTITTSRDIPSDSEASDMEGHKKPEASSSRRRQSTLGLRSSSTNSMYPETTEDPDKLLKRPASVVGIGESGSRSDRFSRRKSTML